MKINESRTLKGPNRCDAFRVDRKKGCLIRGRCPRLLNWTLSASEGHRPCQRDLIRLLHDFLKSINVLSQQGLFRKRKSRQSDQVAVCFLSLRQSVGQVSRQSCLVHGTQRADARKHTFGEERLLMQQRIARIADIATFGSQGLNQRVDGEPCAGREIANQKLEIDAIDVRRWQKGFKAKLF